MTIIARAFLLENCHAELVEASRRIVSAKLIERRRKEFFNSLLTVTGQELAEKVTDVFAGR